MEYSEFVSLVSKMRSAQKAYFRNRTSVRLTESMELERIVDKEILNIESQERLKREPELPFQ